ncbi:tryptophan ABC transporter substrate-binding protein [Enterococcus dongliensis]|uniref:Tryptophan ABC transporter substrate-binding protein n=1 Tax=Enterococcus dongliensis TaxID=2559925 RepID=A0AAP5KUD6_9ENTE|nr:tryptophan ABC transporter substrate-binding protein [Enterococcus dongliensis]MDT2595781.1 tryptophan ABC transporter substrate-binding protein [Enterococcus dongliensis]MDT2612202.1 tryptophan ABC transporter substrate-binding protein [Enterococcus dongliensis]MDT2633771.1 tryptophan ABC transporter substrate-binding protein [Enterococcus dongliensis]MDT2636393.1 tryptophan ABC transporter substrate-binding protein [Enterococcus dongliensis]MDT2639863.1 tryptophan ABC transporter substrat
MKNKGIIGSIIALAVVLIGVFAYQMGSRQTDAATDKKTEVKTVGILQFISHPSLDQIKDGVIEGLKKEGYEDGKNIKVEFLNGQGDQSKLNSMSQQLLEKKSDVLVGIATPAAKALANATNDTPIIMGAISDPVSAGLVKNLKKPAGNVTGVNNLTPVDQQIDMAKELFPKAKTVGMIYSSSEENSKSQIERAEKKAAAVGYTVKKYAISSSNEIATITQQACKETDFLYIPQDNTIASAFQTLISESDKAKKPVFVSVDNMVKEGGIATVGQNQFDLGVETGKMAAAVLSGKSTPADTPVNVIDYGDMIINEEKAKELGITIPANIKEEAEVVKGE